MKNAFRSMLITIAATLIMTFPASAFTYQEVAVEGGGAIKGKITFIGTVPTKTVVPTKDKEVCGATRQEPLIVVDKGGGVKDAVVYIDGINKGKAWGKTETPVVNNNKCRFEPHVQVVRKGKIEVHNADPVLHNTHGFYGNKTAFNIALPIKGMEIPASLKQTGVLRLDCDAHGWMRGWLYVVDNPYYAITGEDGTFMIGDVPPGEYTVVIWQEEKGTMEKKVVVKSGETATLNIELK